MRVNPSPRLNSDPEGEVRKYNPNVTRITPMTLPALGSLRSMAIWNKGVKTTRRPVINPDFDAVVYFSPVVCARKPRNRRTPMISPPRKDSFDIEGSRFATKGRKRSVAMMNRIATKRNGGESSRPSLTTTNVPPQITVQERRNSSARVLIFICFPEKERQRGSSPQNHQGMLAGG